MTFKLTALLNDVNVLQKLIAPENKVDISPFIAKLARGFLPSCVLSLEEYGLPRMISKKIHASGVIDFSDAELTLHDAIRKMNLMREGINQKVKDLDDFDNYVLDYFFEGAVGIN